MFLVPLRTMRRITVADGTESSYWVGGYICVTGWMTYNSRMFSLIVLEPKNLKWRQILLCLFWEPWHSLACLCLLLHIAIFLVSLCLCVSLPGRISVLMDWGHALLQNDFILTYYLCNNCFQIRQHSEVLGIRTAMYLSEWYSSTRNSGFIWVDCPGKATLGGDPWAEPEMWEILGADAFWTEEKAIERPGEWACWSLSLH